MVLGTVAVNLKEVFLVQESYFALGVGCFATLKSICYFKYLLRFVSSQYYLCRKHIL